MIQGIKKCSKIKVFKIARKWFNFVDIILTIPMQLEWAQMESVWLRYRILSTFPNMQNVDCTQFVQSIQDDCANYIVDMERGPYRWHIKVMSWKDELAGWHGPIYWDLKMSKNNLSLTLIYQPEDSSFISRISTKYMQIARRG